VCVWRGGGRNEREKVRKRESVYIEQSAAKYQQFSGRIGAVCAACMCCVYVLCALCVLSSYCVCRVCLKVTWS
jgi:hypothetical protein